MPKRSVKKAGPVDIWADAPTEADRTAIGPSPVADQAHQEQRQEREKEAEREQKKQGVGRRRGDIDDSKVDFKADEPSASDKEIVKWVFEHLEDQDLPRHGPTKGALAMLRWARKNRTEFYSHWKNVCLSKSALESDDSEPRKRSNRDLRNRLNEILKA